MIRPARLVPILALAVAACGAFSEDEARLEGARRDLRAPSSQPVALAPAVALPAPRVNADWPQLGGSAAHAGGHPAGPAALSVAWSNRAVTGGDGRITSGPVIAGGRLFALGAEADVAALDLASGRLLWRADLAPPGEDGGEGYGGGLAAAGGVLFATTGFGEVVALDAASGAERWRTRLGGPVRAAPLVAEGVVIAVTRDNTAHALDAADGARRWTDRASAGGAGILGGAVPAAAQGVAVIPYNSGEIAAVEIASGRRGWVDALVGARRGAAIGDLLDVTGGPVIQNGVAYLANQGGQLVAYELRSGRRVWTRRIGMAQPLWAAEESLFALDVEGRLLRLSATTGAPVWAVDLPVWEDPEDREDPIAWAGPALAGGRVLIVSSTGDLVAHDAETGAQLEATTLGAGAAAGPAVAAGGLYLLDFDGRVTAFR